MSPLVDLLSSNIRESGLEQLSRKLGQDPRTTSEAVDSALPMLIGALGRNAAKDGAEGLNRALDKKHDGGVLDDIAGFIDQDDNLDGNGILDHVFGGSGGLAARVLGAKSGLDQNEATALMATLAPMVLGALGRAKRQHGLDDNAVRQLLAVEERGIDKHSPGFMKLIGGVLDANGDGDTDANDLIRAGMQGLGRFL